MSAPRPAESTCRVPERSITKRPAPSDSCSSSSPAARRNAVRDSSPSSSGARSEEHTSELQSRLHLVCRLLLEKKKKKERQYARGPRERVNETHTNSTA